MTIGHNNPPGLVGIAAEQLRSVIERIERLEEEKAEAAADIREVKAEAKVNGFDLKAINTILKLRRQDAHERDEQEHMVDLYKAALGMAPQLEMFNYEESEEA
jgi:uncharacterized protein (UPF0335 family)